jgi:hypothetical protein
MRIRIGGLLAVALWAASPLANAEYTVEQYRIVWEEESTRDELKTYVLGLGRGISWANAVLEAREGPVLFCLPSERTPSGEDFVSLLDRELKYAKRGVPYDGTKGRTYSATTPIEIILVNALMSSYPCD